jgi:hypothetical protein
VSTLSALLDVAHSCFPHEQVVVKRSHTTHQSPPTLPLPPTLPPPPPPPAGKVLREWKRVHDQDLEVRKRIKKLMQAMNKHVFDGWLEVLKRRKKSAQCFRDKQVILRPQAPRAPCASLRGLSGPRHLTHPASPPPRLVSPRLALPHHHHTASYDATSN